VIGQLSASTIRTLDKDLGALRNCHGAAKCWQAGQPSP
jgi:hypothetical protein